MTTLLQKGIEAVRALPDDRQDLVGELLLQFAGAEPAVGLTSLQLDDVRLSFAEADRGEFVSDAALAETWKKFGL